MGLPKFPMEIFPSQIADYANEFSQSCGAVPEYFACGVLAATSSIASKSELKVKNRYFEYPNLYLCLVGRPGLAKSPPIKESLSPIFSLQKKGWTAYGEELEEWNKKMKAANRKEKEELQEEKPVYPAQYITTKGTIEGIFDSFVSNIARGDAVAHTIYYKDELNAFFKDMNQYRSGGSGSDMETFLTLFNGGDIYLTNKAERRCIPNAALTVIGTIQPKIMREAMEQGKDNGLIERFLFAVTDDSPKPSNIYSGVGEKTAREYHSYMHKLIKSNPCIQYHLSTEIKPLIQKVYDYLYEIGGTHETGAFKKWEIIFHKFIINLAVLHQEQEVAEETINRAELLIKYFAGHWLAGYEITETSTSENIEIELKEWFSSAKALTDREIKRKRKYQKCSEAVNIAIASLLEEGFIDSERLGRKMFYTLVEEIDD